MNKIHMSREELTRSKMSLNAKAKYILSESKHIPDFGYHGDLDLGGTWAFTFGVCRDSGQLERSNWEVISSDMIKKHPQSVEITRCNHWAVGWVDYLTVKMIDKNGRITRAGLDVLDWYEKLADYPLADEDHYSDLQWEEGYDGALQSIRYDHPTNMIDDLPENWVGLIYEWIHENDQDSLDEAVNDNEGWLDKDTIETACEALGYLESEEESEPEKPMSRIPFHAIRYFVAQHHIGDSYWSIGREYYTRATGAGATRKERRLIISYAMWAHKYNRLLAESLRF